MDAEKKLQDPLDFKLLSDMGLKVYYCYFDKAKSMVDFAMDELHESGQKAAYVREKRSYLEGMLMCLSGMGIIDDSVYEAELERLVWFSPEERAGNFADIEKFTFQDIGIV